MSKQNKLTLTPPTLALFNKLTHPSRNKLKQAEAQTYFEKVLMDLLVNMSLLPNTTSVEGLKIILSDLHINPIITEKHENPYFRALSISLYLFQLSLSASKIFFNQEEKLLTQAIKSIANNNLVDINPSLLPGTMEMMDDLCRSTATTIIDTLLTHVTLSERIDLPALKNSLQETLYLSLQTINMSPRSMKSLLHTITYYYLDNHATVENISSAKTHKEDHSLQIIVDTWHQEHISSDRINLGRLGNQLLNSIPGATPRRIFGYIAQSIQLLRYAYCIPLLACLLHISDIVTIDPQYVSLNYWLGDDLNIGLLIVATVVISGILVKQFQRAAINAQTTFQRKIDNDIEDAFVFNRRMIAVDKTKTVVVIQGKDPLPLHIQGALWNKYNKEKTHRPSLEDGKKTKPTNETTTVTASDKQQEKLALPTDHYPYFRENILSGVILLRALKSLGKGNMTIGWWRNILQSGRFSIESTSNHRNKGHGTHKVKPFGRSPARLLLNLKKTDIPASIPKVPYYVVISSRASHV